MLKERPQGTCYFVAQFYLEATRFLACQNWHLQLILHFLVSQTTLTGKKHLFPVISACWQQEKASVLADLLNRESVTLIGDGCCDSPGYSAKYGTYTMMDEETKKIVDFEVCRERNNKFPGNGETRLPALSRPRAKQWNSHRSGGYR